MKDQERIQYLKAKYPNVPEHCLPLGKKGKKKSPANQLTQDVMDYVVSIGGYAFRINSQGTYSEKLQKFILSGSTKGVSDVIAVLKGLTIAIEIKHGQDRQSEIQKKFQDRITAAGGIYIIAKDLQTFKQQFKQYIL